MQQSLNLFCSVFFFCHAVWAEVQYVWEALRTESAQELQAMVSATSKASIRTAFHKFVRVCITKQSQQHVFPLR